MMNKIEQCKTNEDTLALLRMIHGKDVICTDGLFHIFDSKHREVYINAANGELDKRGLYITLVVLDNIVVSIAVNSSIIRFVVLNKQDLKCIYKTTGNIYFIDMNLVCDKHKKYCTLISHSGKNIWRYTNTLRIDKLYKNIYLVKSYGIFEDKIISYSEHRDMIKNLTENKRYAIHTITDSKISIADMNGGNYTYDFDTQQCFDVFKDRQIDRTALFL